MHDQRIVRGPSLSRIYFLRGGRIERIPSQPVHRFRRKRYQTAGPDDLTGPLYDLFLYLFFIHSDYFCIHKSIAFTLSHFIT